MKALKASEAAAKKVVAEEAALVQAVEEMVKKPEAEEARKIAAEEEALWEEAEISLSP